MLRLRALTVSLLAVAAIGSCTGQSDERTVRGRLRTDQFHLVGAQAIAIDAEGASYRATLTGEGEFALALPVGREYSLRFANSTEVDGVYDAFAVLVSADGAGVTYKRFVLERGPTIELGRIFALGTQGAGLSLATGGDDDGDSDADADSDSEDADDDSDDADSDDTAEDDVDGACDLAGGGDMQAVVAENDVLAEEGGEASSMCTADDADSDSDDDSDSDGTDTSTDADDDSDSSSDDADDDSDSDSDGDCDDVDDACPPPAGEVPPVNGNPGNPGDV
jgi:hypothetical protein